MGFASHTSSIGPRCWWYSSNTRLQAILLQLAFMDYCNSLMFDTSNKKLAKLQSVTTRFRLLATAHVALQVPTRHSSSAAITTRLLPVVRGLIFSTRLGYKRCAQNTKAIVLSQPAEQSVHNIINVKLCSSRQRPLLAVRRCATEFCCRRKREQTSDRCSVIW